jgi:hypothetical protein
VAGGRCKQLPARAEGKVQPVFRHRDSSMATIDAERGQQLGAQSVRLPAWFVEFHHIISYRLRNRLAVQPA